MVFKIEKYMCINRNGNMITGGQEQQQLKEKNRRVYRSFEGSAQEQTAKKPQGKKKPYQPENGEMITNEY